jgi:UDP-N-acetylglucosamine--N-acetylmuramyl-(pentapeptide) pyrophosphoryl-undecaprenol N-acetylglucosamine transferase
MFHRTAFRNADPARGRAQLGVPDGLPIVFFLGGSQGARQINELVRRRFPAWPRESAFVVHQTGESGAGGAPSRGVFERPPLPRRFSFIREEMSDLLAAADLVVGRAGAGTLWECAALANP